MTSTTNENYNCILVKKNGSLKQLRPIPANEKIHSTYMLLSETSDAYSSSFRLHTTWKVSKYKVSVELWARATGRAGQENQYEFPPPVDETLFFGNCLLVVASSSPDFSFSIEAWKKIYAHLFGGFHDLTKTETVDENEYDELTDVPTKRKTRDGYLKDGFIVDDPCDKSAKQVKSRSKNKKISSSGGFNGNCTVNTIVSDPSRDDEDELIEEQYLNYESDE
jgi:hypothetical protein